MAIKQAFFAESPLLRAELQASARQPIMSEGLSSLSHSPHANNYTSSGFPSVSHSQDDSATPIALSETMDDVIPPTHVFRTLVLCFDGTGDQFDSDVADVHPHSSLSADCRGRTRILSNCSLC